MVFVKCDTPLVALGKQVQSKHYVIAFSDSVVCNNEWIGQQHDAPDALTREALTDAEDWARRKADKVIAAAS